MKKRVINTYEVDAPPTCSSECTLPLPKFCRVANTEKRKSMYRPIFHNITRYDQRERERESEREREEY
jgi:hypothetical protein